MLGTASGLGVNCAVGLGFAALVACSFLLTLFVFSDVGSTLLWLQLATVELSIALGIIVLAGGICRAVAQEYTRNTWENLLVIPHARHEIVLCAVGHAYSPTFFIVTLGPVALGALMLASSQQPAADMITTDIEYPASRWAVCCWHILGLEMLLLVEWLQLAPLGVAVGIRSACSRSGYAGLGAVFLFGLATVLVRAGGGGLAAVLLPLPANEVVLFVGPLSAMTAVYHLPMGLIFGATYLVALEVLVRRLFAWSITRIGE